MKRMLWLLGICVILTGCGGQNRDLAAAMEFREKLLAAEGCHFQTKVTADYGDSLHTFSMDCGGNGTGALTFEITAPESIAGIRGTVQEDGGNLLFEEDTLYFPLLTDDHLTPASAPWIFLRSLRSGCITSVCREEALLRITVDDTYEEDALTLDVWMKEEEIPIRADILYDGRRILSMDVESFEMP